MMIAYADPPYSGKASAYGRAEVRQDRLLRALQRFDGWAMSCHVRGLLELAPLVPKEARIVAWCKTWVCFKKNVWPPFSWEPVIFKAARHRDLGDAPRFVRDWVVDAANMNGFFGSKPMKFCGWLFEILGCEPEDEFHDLFYGSGAVTKAWEQWRKVKKAGGPLFVKEGA